MGEASVSYSLKYNSRCIVAQPADTVNSKWLVGTNALREENEVRRALGPNRVSYAGCPPMRLRTCDAHHGALALTQVLALQYDADGERIVCTHAYTHPAEVWDIAPCPTSEDMFLTVWSKGACVPQPVAEPLVRQHACVRSLQHVCACGAQLVRYCAPPPQTHSHLQEQHYCDELPPIPACPQVATMASACGTCRLRGARLTRCSSRRSCQATAAWCAGARRPACLQEGRKEPLS